MKLPLASRIVRLVLVLVVLFACFLTWKQTSYERSLAASSITFDDFPPAYAEALKKAQLEDKVPIYDWPRLSSPAPEAQTTIPPVIHFIWFRDLYHEHLDISEISHFGSHAPDACRKHNPDYEIFVWNATAARALMEEHYSWLLPTYDGYQYPIQQVDAFKYVLLWHYGGVYMDLDFACRRPLDPLLPFSAWYPKASPFGVNNDLMASRARYSFVGSMLQHLAPRDVNLISPYLTIFWSTGPQFTSDMLSDWFWHHGGHAAATPANKGLPHTPATAETDIDADKIYVLPQEFYSEKYTFFGHSPGGTWHGKDFAVVLWLVDNPWVFVVAAVLCSLAFVGYLTLRRRGRKAAIKRLEVRDA